MSYSELINEVYLNNYRRLYSSACRIVGEDSAGDAVNTAFLSLLEKESEYSGLDRNELMLLAFTVVKNKAIDIYRKDARELSTDESVPASFFIYESSPEDEYLLKEQKVLIMEHIKDLMSEENYRLLFFRYVLELTPAEIAQIKKTDAEHVSQELYKIKSKCKKIIKKYDFLTKNSEISFPETLYMCSDD